MKSVSKAFELLIDNDITNNKCPNIDYTYDYNCWGFVAWTLHLDNKLYWFDRCDIEHILKKHTNKICDSQVKIGDIGVYRDKDYNNILTHTTIMLDSITAIHKPGPNALMTEHPDKIGFAHNYGELTEYRRVI